MEDVLTIFQESLRRLHVSKKDRLLLAVSGGLDSVVLTELSAMSRLDFGIAHANFQLRGAESERDEAFVRDMARKYNRAIHVRTFDTKLYSENEKMSVQVAARNLRYDWFKSLLGNEPFPFRFLLTAHHLDDNIETMLMHFFRGTGISGLKGIPEKNENIIRPLLDISKDRLRSFATGRNLLWVEDSSNQSGYYTRNVFRNQILPDLVKIYPDIHHNLESNLQRFSEAELLYQQAIGLYKKKLLKTVGSEIHIPILLLKKSVPLRTIVYEIIKDFHFSAAQSDDVIHLMDSNNGRYISSSTCRIIKNRHWLIIAPFEENFSQHVIVDQSNSSIIYPGGILQLKYLSVSEPETLREEAGLARLDADKIQFPLILRKWKTGDYFYPLGMNKKKKLARYFIDQKLSKTAKEKIWVLVMNSQIVWVVGQRIDNRFRIKSSTTKILRIKSEDA
jgi:tRNA(Ile)-lysidine synthase